MNTQMLSKSYYINIINSGFISQTEIPTEYLYDTDIINLMTLKKWFIVNINPHNIWTTIVKSQSYYD
jgi:hypothetical protein